MTTFFHPTFFKPTLFNTTFLQWIFMPEIKMLFLISFLSLKLYMLCEKLLLETFQEKNNRQNIRFYQLMLWIRLGVGHNVSGKELCKLFFIPGVEFLFVSFFRSFFPLCRLFAEQKDLKENTKSTLPQKSIMRLSAVSLAFFFLDQ